MTDHDWSDVPAALARLAADPGARAVFGAAAHGFVLDPPLTGPELTELEEQLGVPLPAGYRSFLRQAGRGGAGPAYGLFPVRRVDGRWRWEGDGADLTDLAALARPFAHTGAFNPADALPPPPDEGDYDSAAALEAAEDAYQEEYDRVVYAPEHSVGLLYLCHLGCALREALVVTGPARGQMWADDSADGGGYRPLRDDDGRPLDFARWYRRWLTAALVELGPGPADSRRRPAGDRGDPHGATPS
ncbi:SMI1/KNR4 family protein [Micromonospora cathayae]|uniref:SMI1/KNR4 family protein n=1 Tax=Micromonospora cathayae TaxID=3028804 RepID=A0ABY7ZKE8_9ACTN|nr:SMI1/KNR4 family protein [Micromonospora sp. HUAS 3]WDZ83464.1 SMI1/KNR4 family protein [Micromonospora sp. HUAS 3]